MKYLVPFFVSFFAICFSFTNAQNIPFGTSFDSLEVYPGEIHYLYYYKPLNYDSVNSPLIFAVHGLGMNGNDEINDLFSIADKRKALIVAPDMHSNWASGIDLYFPDSTSNCVWWYPMVFKKIYRYTLEREVRDSISSYLIGFSAGGQFVTRYMLIRQGVKDSIPFLMAISTNPYFYTFCTETLNGQDMFYPYGLKWGIYNTPNCSPNSNPIPLPFACDEHVFQYYNENYAVLIGTADTIDNPPTPSSLYAEGNNRYERAQNFYHFSDSDAVARGTTLQWQYGEVPGVGHNENLMYNTVLAGDSMPLAERLLFETPYHNVPNLAPFADFSVDTNIVSLPGATVQFQNNSVNVLNFQWDFGDGTTNDIDFNPSHTYTFADTFTVTLTIYSPWDCENISVKKDLIVVLPVGINVYNNLFNYSISPNPANNECSLNFQMNENENDFSVQVLNYLGQAVNVPQNTTVDANNKITIRLNTQNLVAGIYFVKITGSNGVGIAKMVVQH